MAGDNGTDPADERNVHGDPLHPCSTDPMTGVLRDGTPLSADD